MHHATVSNAVVPLERETQSGPMNSRPNMAPCPGREATVFNEMDKHKADQIPASPGKRCSGSRSYTPCECVHTPCNRSQSGHHSSSRHHSHSRCHSHSTTPNRDRPCDHNSASKKWPVDPKSRPTQPTPTQSPTQKMPKLKSVIQRVPAYQHFSQTAVQKFEERTEGFHTVPTG